MKDFTSRLPLPITVLALAWVVLGSTFQGVIPFLSDMSMIISLILIVLTILKFVFDTKNFYKALKSPVGLSLFSTFSMTLMMLAVWMKDAFDNVNIYVWTAGVILHTVLMVVFTLKYVLNFKFKYIFPSWFLIYTGIGIATVTCNDFGMMVFGKAVYNFIIVISVILAPFILIRVLQRTSTNAAKPIVSMMAVPLAVILPAYMAVTKSIDIDRLWIMFIAIQVIFFLVIIHMVIRIFHGFYPSWATYATALAMSLYASSTFENYLVKMKIEHTFIMYLVYCEFILVFIVCAMILLAYFINALEDPQEHERRIHERVIQEKFEREKRIRERREARGGYSSLSKSKTSEYKKIKKSIKKEEPKKKIIFDDDDDIFDLID